MLLYFQHLDASATTIAFAACLSPVLNILQIPSARFIERVGYRRFVLSGWTTRSIIVVGMMMVTLMQAHKNRDLQILLMLGLGLIYNVLRGISVCGILPWFAHIVPEKVRGVFLARHQLASAVSAILILVIAGRVLHLPERWHPYTLLYGLGAVCAFASLIFLRRIPDVPAEKVVDGPALVPWADILFHTPFVRYLGYNIVMNLALGASSVFWVRFLRSSLHVSESNILFIAASTTTILAIGLLLIGPLIDRGGNKAPLAMSALFFITNYICLAAVAAHVISYSYPVMGLQVLASGLGFALWNLANVRMVMEISPVMGRAHFLALYSVSSNLTYGLVSLLWGPLMDHLDHWQCKVGVWTWNNYSIFYCTLAFTVGVGMVMLRWVPEIKTMALYEFTSELFLKMPGRAFLRLADLLRTPMTG